MKHHQEVFYNILALRFGFLQRPTIVRLPFRNFYIADDLLIILNLEGVAFREECDGYFKGVNTFFVRINLLGLDWEDISDKVK